MRLKDKVCIITGGGNGIGHSIALKFVKEGAKVAVVDMNEAAINQTVAELKELGGDAIGFKVDVTKKEEISAMVSSVVENYGRVDVLVNNAGILMDAQLTKMTDTQFDKVIDVNLKGPYLCSKAVVDIMIAQRSGVILNTSSIVGIYGNFGQTNYAASKFGVIGFTKTWAKELGKRGIRTNAVCPGFVGTDIIKAMPENIIKDMENKVPLKRLGKPEEIANVFAFLASDEASYINGAVLEVSGGIVI